MTWNGSGITARPACWPTRGGNYSVFERSGSPVHVRKTRPNENPDRGFCHRLRIGPGPGIQKSAPFRGPDMTDTPVHAPPISENEPQGDLCIRTLAMPADTNANGDIFGGWLLSQMDIGGGVAASKIAKTRTVTVSIEAMNFRKPVYVGDLVSVHANLVRVGRTSITVHLEAWVL